MILFLFWSVNFKLFVVKLILCVVDFVKIIFLVDVLINLVIMFFVCLYFLVDFVVSWYILWWILVLLKDK